MKSLFLLFATILVAVALAQPAVAGRPGSVGLQVLPVTSGELVVLAVVADSPAATAGILPGDLLVRLGGHSLRGRDFAIVAREDLPGEVGTELVLEWLRPGEAGSRTARLQRVWLDPQKTVPIRRPVYGPR